LIIGDVVGRLELAVYSRAYILCSIEVVEKFLTHGLFLSNMNAAAQTSSWNILLIEGVTKEAGCEAGSFCNWTKILHALY
jgi:hypothetical protein